MSESLYYRSETARLKAIAAQCRMRAIESQLALGMTLCAVAETEMRWGRLERVDEILDKLRKSGERIHLHLSEPGHVPQGSTTDLRKQLKQLEERVIEIAIAVRQQKWTTLSCRCNIARNQAPF